MSKHPLFPDDVIETYFSALFHPSKRIASVLFDEIYLPKADVYYVRASVEAATGVRYPLSHVEEAMYLEGMIEAEECYKKATLYE